MLGVLQLVIGLVFVLKSGQSLDQSGDETCEIHEVVRAVAGSQLPFDPSNVLG